MAKRQMKLGTALTRSRHAVGEGGDAAPVIPIRAGDGLENLIAGLGTHRDKRAHSHYALPPILTRYDLENMWRGSWLGKRIVSAVANAMTSKWRNFTFSDTDDNTNIDLLTKEEAKFWVKDKFNEAETWARLYGGAFIIMGTRDAINTLDMAKPLKPENVRKGDLKYLHVVDRWRCAPTGLLDQDLMSPNFGRPLTYKLSESAVEIHWTRVIRFNGEKLPWLSWLQNGMWDDSALQHVMDSVMNYDTTTSAIISMLFEANIDVVTTKGLTNLLSTKDGEAKVQKRFQLSQMMKSFNRTLVLDDGETYDKKQNSFANIDKIWQQAMVDVSGASHVPVSILFGDQTGTGMSSSGDDDEQNWHTHVEDEREKKITPGLNQFDQVFVRHTIGSMPDDYESVWNPLGAIDDAERSATEYQDAQRDQIYLTTGVVSEGLVASQLKIKGTYQSMSSEDVKLAEELGEKQDETDDAVREQTMNPPEPAPVAGPPKGKAKK